MTTTEAIMLIGIAVTALISVANLYLSLQSRKNPYFQQLWGKQTDAFLELYPLLNNLLDCAIDSTHRLRRRSTEDVFEAPAKFITCWTKHELLMPTKVTEAIDEIFSHALIAINRNVLDNAKWKSDLQSLQKKIANAMRDGIGMDHLAKLFQTDSIAEMMQAIRKKQPDA